MLITTSKKVDPTKIFKEIEHLKIGKVNSMEFNVSIKDEHEGLGQWR